MAFQSKTSIEGCPVLYQVNQNAKKYTLKDNGFIETKSGNFQVVRPLDATPQSKEGFKLKITISNDLKTLKMSVTTANGLKSINLFKNDSHLMSQEKFYFLIDGMISRGVLEKIS